MSRLWLDTNVARSTGELRKLAKAASGKQVTITIHAQVYLEDRRQMQVKCRRDGTTFDAVKYDSFLSQLGYETPEMRVTRANAASWADTLFERYSTHQAWEDAKKATLGGELRKGFEVEPGSMPMTTDWLIALEIEHDPDSYVITEDSGEEWEALRQENPSRVFTWEQGLAWLLGRPSAGPDPGSSENPAP